MKGHFEDIKKYFRRGTHTDSFAWHMVKHLTKKTNDEKVRKLCHFRVLTTINPFIFTKNAKSYDCRLCLAEKSTIVWKILNKVKLMNDNSEI